MSRDKILVTLSLSLTLHPNFEFSDKAYTENNSNGRRIADYSKNNLTAHAENYWYDSASAEKKNLLDLVHPSVREVWCTHRRSPCRSGT